MGTSPETGEYRRKLIDAFPPLPFGGLVSTHDECDDGILLRRELGGMNSRPRYYFTVLSGCRCWTPAPWSPFFPLGFFELWRPAIWTGNEDDGWDEKRTAETVVLFNSGQRDAVADFLGFVANRTEGRDWKERAEFGLSWWQPK